MQRFALLADLTFKQYVKVAANDSFRKRSFLATFPLTDPQTTDSAGYARPLPRCRINRLDLTLLIGT
jgi:hypothetical protein